MSVPSSKRSKSRSRKGAAHQSMKASNPAVCTKCGKAVSPHRACSSCGNYSNRTVVDTARREARLERKHKA